MGLDTQGAKFKKILHFSWFVYERRGYNNYEHYGVFQDDTRR